MHILPIFPLLTGEGKKEKKPTEAPGAIQVPGRRREEKAMGGWGEGGV